MKDNNLELTTPLPSGIYAVTRWAIGSVTGSSDRVIYSGGLPLLFRTRWEAREYIRENYGYILTREDLRSPPHNWRLPKAIKVSVNIVRI